MAAPRSGETASNAFIRSVLGRKTCICPAKNRARNPNPLNAKLECPEGKLLHPSCKVWGSVSVQTEISTRIFCGVVGAGLQRDIKSGRGRPTAFLTTSVMKVVRKMLARVSDEN